MAGSTTAPPSNTPYPDMQGAASRARDDEDGGWLGSSLRRGREAYERVGDGAGWLSDQFGELADQRPFASVGTGFAAGLLIGFLVGLLIWED